jgi:6-pyruvoyl-tetrahydropterin synthase
MALVTLTKRYSFRGVHRLTSGVHREKYHGHRYSLEVCVSECPPSAIDLAVSEKVISKLDGKDLTGVLPTTTGEVLVDWIHAELEKSALRGKIFSVALQETRKNRFVSARSDARAI